tara:strand:+ start:1837 stop:2397 length:561 start_codon:yes stop_codon:yes gene_type:complete
MDKKVLSEIALYHGVLEMPENFDIDRKKLASDILDAGAKKHTPTDQGVIYYKSKDCIIPFSRQSDMLNTYITEKFKAYYDELVYVAECYGNVFPPQEKSYLRNHVNPMYPQDSPKFVMLYGVSIGKDEKCKVVLEYDDNFEKGKDCHITLEENDYIVFPSTLKYIILPNQSFRTNIILTSTFNKVT